MVKSDRSAWVPTWTLFGDCWLNVLLNRARARQFPILGSGDRGGARADCNSPEVPEPAHPRPLCLLEQQLVIGGLLGQLEVLLVPLLVLVRVGRQVVRDVPRQVRRDGADLRFDLVDEFRRGRDLVGRVGEAEVEEDADRREREGAPERGVEA